MIWTIRGRKAFQTLARSGRKARTDTLWCSFLNDPTAVPLRLGFAVGRSVGRATRRNLLRRRLRAIVGTATSELGIDHGWLLIGARPDAAKHTFASLRVEVLKLLSAISEAPRQ